MNTTPGNNKIILIHLGGLGDMCLSESIFLSLSKHYEGNIEALGYTRFLKLFDEYFAQIHRIESTKWLHLFSDHNPDIIYKQIIFIGKDRKGILRKRWKNFSKEPLVFIEMYPENQFTTDGSLQTNCGIKNLPSAMSHELCSDNIHVEDYQLLQLAQYGIEAIKKEIEPKPLCRVILYPEKGFQKRKWPVENFIDLYSSLKSKDIDAWILESPGIEINIKDKKVFQELQDIKALFQGGGIFVSNDSGMAHLAGMCGLFSITIFIDYNPVVWHPRGRFLTFKEDTNFIDISAIETMITKLITQGFLPHTQ